MGITVGLFVFLFCRSLWVSRKSKFWVWVSLSVPLWACLSLCLYDWACSSSVGMNVCECVRQRQYEREGKTYVPTLTVKTELPTNPSSSLLRSGCFQPSLLTRQPQVSNISKQSRLEKFLQSRLPAQNKLQSRWPGTQFSILKSLLLYRWLILTHYWWGYLESPQN